MSEPGDGRERLLIEAFVGLADTLVDDYDVIDLLDRLVNHCERLLAAESVGILLADTDGRLRVLASSNEQTEHVELLQLQAEQGPCVDCYRTMAPVSAPDLHGPEARDRWPEFTAAVRQRANGDYRSVHAVPMRLRGRALGALNLFHRDPGPSPEADLILAQGLADVATIGILQERTVHRGEVLNEQLQTALNSRVIIEQAKGVLAERGGLSMDAAFDRLRGHARARNQRLSQLARQVADRHLALDDVLAPPAHEAAAPDPEPDPE